MIEELAGNSVARARVDGAHDGEKIEQAEAPYAAADRRRACARPTAGSTCTVEALEQADLGRDDPQPAWVIDIGDAAGHVLSPRQDCLGLHRCRSGRV
jgi:hypothetical protein